MVEPRFETRSIPHASYHALGYRASLILLILVREIRNFSSGLRQPIRILWLGLLLTSGCIRLERISTETPPALEVPTGQATVTTPATSTPDYGWKEVSYLIEDVCFEAGFDATGRVFKIPDASALDAFYAQVDHSQLCENLVNRVAYPFSEGEVIVGLWSSGTGCNARHVVQNVRRDNAEKQEALQLQFITEGDCPYELVQPFWIALPQSADFNINIEVQAAQ